MNYVKELRRAALYVRMTENMVTHYRRTIAQEQETLQEWTRRHQEAQSRLRSITDRMVEQASRIKRRTKKTTNARGIRLR